ncbi:MAG: FtsX-like permease family protein, partial [Lachnospiraceae bacterium]|nr:FtsX-like permease family protein [Lachnospiraceae bacterium]
LAGSFVFPSMIWKAYSIMYDFTDTLEYYLNVPLSLSTFALYVAGMLLVTYLSLRRTLKEVPSQLLRPKPPKHGKRVALERVSFVWRRLSFMWKVTMRNIFRYKERVLMMTLGVGGCTALMLTGFGIRDSIEDVVVYQYDEILHYSYDVLFSEDMDEAARADFAGKVTEAGGETLFVLQETRSAGANGREKSALLSVVSEPERLQTFFALAANGEPLPYPGTGEVMINTGMAADLNLKKGDSLTLTVEDQRHSLTVSGVFDNYINNYAFVSEESYTGMTGHAPETKVAWIRTEEDAADLTPMLLNEEKVLNVTTAATLKERIGTIMENMIYIVFLTTISAAALAFIVIYNLTNINITERMREIATVKVLGFYGGEAAGYVLRENLLLTLLGAILGLPLGLLLTRFVIHSIKVDLVYFTAKIMPFSFVLCIVLTLLFGALVDLVMIRKLNRIDMAAALKAAE